MSFTNDEELISLRNSLNTLMSLVNELHLEERPYFLRFLDRMKNNIETGICMVRMERMRPEDWMYLEEILRRDWEEANRIDMGIPSYDNLFSEKIYAGKMSGMSYAALLFEIEQSLNGEKPVDWEEYDMTEYAVKRKYKDISGLVGV